MRVHVYHGKEEAALFCNAPGRRVRIVTGTHRGIAIQHNLAIALHGSREIVDVSSLPWEVLKDSPETTVQRILSPAGSEAR